MKMVYSKDAVNFFGESYVFQQDGAAAHTACSTLNWLRLEAKVKLKI